MNERAWEAGLPSKNAGGPLSRAARRHERQPIAIIGIGCRLPGGVDGPESYWRLLWDKVDAITEIPVDRFDARTYYDPRPATPGKMATRWGGFLAHIDRFDAQFFGIAPREAERMDPQQRLLLEVAWEALEDAGQTRDNLLAAPVGVFVGMWVNDYEARAFRDPGAVDFHMTTGTGRYAASGRLSYVFGLEGPSLTVDTACSSSLVAVHLACQSLRNGECELALAAAANVILQPHITIAYSQSRVMSPDGRCKFGDARANGYVRSEGVGVLVLKPLRQALADRDPIYAVIRGSAATNDGCSSGAFSRPACRGQEKTLRRAYQDAGVSPGRVQYVEAHGTGTFTGDPVELTALGTVLAEGRPAGQKCLVGSVKSNIGHTEAAAGMAGLIKVALALKHRAIPASLHLETPNPSIPWGSLPLRIQTEPSPWPAAAEGRALAGVNAFGISGTNSHVVLQEAPFVMPAVDTTELVRLLPLSAHCPEAVTALAGAYRDFLLGDGDNSPALVDVCYTAALRRTRHEHRLALVFATRAEALNQIDAHLRGEAHPGAISGCQLARQRKVVFVFPGQGSQWLGMGRELLASEPVFRQALVECEAAIRPYVDWSLLGQLQAEAEESRLGE
ncbi:MAG: type I polyketide synthase, partial [Chloroflexota bacterium]